MRILILLAILLAFPALEIMLLVELGSRFGWWLLGYLLLAALGGWTLMVGERVGAFARMAMALRDGEHPGFALLASARNMVAGLLLLLPGVLSDGVALLLLLVPMSFFRRRLGVAETAKDNVIEGEWRRDD